MKGEGASATVPRIGGHDRGLRSHHLQAVALREVQCGVELRPDPGREPQHPNETLIDAGGPVKLLTVYALGLACQEARSADSVAADIHQRTSVQLRLCARIRRGRF